VVASFREKARRKGKEEKYSRHPMHVQEGEEGSGGFFSQNLGLTCPDPPEKRKKGEGRGGELSSFSVLVE
jgi:hypothetical protein